MEIAVVVYEGVLDSECEAFRSVLGLVTDAHVTMVGARAGRYSGPGGSQLAERRFDEVTTLDVVIVPGGLGCERAADDPLLRDFLHRMEHNARFIAGSSTGSVVLAAAGLLHGQPAATHWLASDLLRRYGSEADTRRLVMTGNVITCEGQISAVDAAFALVERLDGSDAVDRIRTTLIERGQPLLLTPGVVDRVLALVRRWLGVDELGPTDRDDARHDAHDAHGDAEAPVTPLAVMVELVDNDDLRRRMKRSSTERRHR